MYFSAYGKIEELKKHIRKIHWKSPHLPKKLSANFQGFYRQNIFIKKMENVCFSEANENASSINEKSCKN
jgi:hypothetical protein